MKIFKYVKKIKYPRNFMECIVDFFDRDPDFVVGPNDDPYLFRWYLIPRNRFFNIYLHKFLRDDDDRVLHCHPWPSLSILLKGGYVEITKRGKKEYMPGAIKFRRATYTHRIVLFRDWDLMRIKPWRFGSFVMTGSIIPAWTLFITGPKVREWYFHCQKGLVHWRDYVGVKEGEQKGNEIGKGCGE